MFGIDCTAQMKYVHNISVSVFVRPEDVLDNAQIDEQIRNSLMKMLPIDWQKESVSLKLTEAEGFEGRKIRIYELRMDKEKHTTLFIRYLLSRLDQQQKHILVEEKESRLDENDDFFLRFDKQKMLNAKYELTTGGDCFHIRMNIAAFPKKRENALKIIDEIFKR